MRAESACSPSATSGSVPNARRTSEKLVARDQQRDQHAGERHRVGEHGAQRRARRAGATRRAQATSADRAGRGRLDGVEPADRDRAEQQRR